jgi:hypothetical protein
MRSRLALRTWLLAVALAAIAIVLLVRDPDRWLVASVLLLIAARLAVSGTLASSVRLSDEGIDFWTWKGPRHWAWLEITEAHLSGTGTIPGIAIYRGSTYLKLGTGQFPNLGLAARYVENHLPREVVRSSWARR